MRTEPTADFWIEDSNDSVNNPASMALNLSSLEQAATRYSQHCEAGEKADPDVLKRSRREASLRHRTLFVAAGEKMAKLKAAVAAGETPPEAELFDASTLVPEIAFRDNDLRPVRFLQLATLAARSVGRIRVRDVITSDEGDATGFLVAPGLLMTNYHVLPTQEVAAAASVIFDDEETLQGAPKETVSFELQPDRLFVPDKNLDFAIVQVAARSSGGKTLSSFGFFRLFRQTGKLDPNQREAANIIQHPGGGSKKIALRDNYIAPVLPDGVDPARQLNSLFYGTDTLKGSSGSPVCSDQWFVVALHRGGVPETKVINGKRVVVRHDGSPALRSDTPAQIRYLTNEGTRVSRIYADLESKASANAHAAQALERLLAVSRDPRQGPLDIQSAPIRLPGMPTAEMGGAEEIIRRRADKFEGARGYQPGFLGRGRRVALPVESSEVARELATLKDSNATELKYLHYSLKMNQTRRTPFYVAVNIDGSLLWQNQDFGRRPTRPQWSYDPRMDEAWQPDDEIFSTAMQRGHLFKREDAAWGETQEDCVRADVHSFTITNATPMIANFNNVEWGDLEDLVTRECEAGKKISYFAGPIFRSSDPTFSSLLAGGGSRRNRRGMRVPQSFWKIVAWVEGSRLQAAGFILHQTDEIAAHGPITDEIHFGNYTKCPITEIEAETGLGFPDLVAVDTFEPA